MGKKFCNFGEFSIAKNNYKEQDYTKEDILECYRKIAPTKEEIVKFIPEINIYQFIERVEN